MLDNWTRIYHSIEVFKVEVLKEFLLHNDIVAVVINKNDSAHLVFGEAELYVENGSVELATKLIQGDERIQTDFSDLEFSVN